MPKYHPSLEMLTDYASGSLRPSHALPVAAHLEYCGACRKRLVKLNGIGGQLIERQVHQPAAVESATALKDRVMNAIESTPAEQEPRLEVQPSSRGSLPRCLQQFTTSGLQNLVWAQITPSMRLATLCRDKDGALIGLSRVKPGGKMPHHRHTGDELTMVLEGSFSDESGVYREGDFVMRDTSHRHKPTVTRDKECICLVVLDSPIQFTGFFTRLLNPLVRRAHA